MQGADMQLFEAIPLVSALLNLSGAVLNFTVTRTRQHRDTTAPEDPPKASKPIS
jgi:hypothetical protein